MITTVPSIQHVSLEVEPGLVSDEAAFWELLGFERIESPQGVGGCAVWLATGEQAVAIFFLQ